MAEIKLLKRWFVVLFFVICTTNYCVTADLCETVQKKIQPKTFIAEDKNEYYIINLPNFVQEAVAIDCLPNKSCARGTCQQDYKLHQFMSVPSGKQQFELSELKFRNFLVPYGCKCGA